MKKLYNLLKYMIYASFYVIVVKTGMDFYEYKRFPRLYNSYSAPWYIEALLYGAASLAVIVISAVLRVIIRHKWIQTSETNLQDSDDRMELNQHN